MAGEPDLSPNTSSAWVMYLQQMLNHYYQASVVQENGDFDEQTVVAVRHLRQQLALGDSADVDGSIWGALTGESRGSGGVEEQLTGDEPLTVMGSMELEPPHRFKVWVNAFIPGSYAANIDGVGAAAGHRLLPGPASWFNDCFHTDDREYSDDISASHRMHSEMELE